jgi:hypothetical protein
MQKHSSSRQRYYCGKKGCHSGWCDVLLTSARYLCDDCGEEIAVRCECLYCGIEFIAAIYDPSRKTQLPELNLSYCSSDHMKAGLREQKHATLLEQKHATLLEPSHEQSPEPSPRTAMRQLSGMIPSSHMLPRHPISTPSPESSPRLQPMASIGPKTLGAPVPELPMSQHHRTSIQHRSRSPSPSTMSVLRSARHVSLEAIPSLDVMADPIITDVKGDVECSRCDKSLLDMVENPGRICTACHLRRSLKERIADSGVEMVPNRFLEIEYFVTDLYCDNKARKKEGDSLKDSKGRAIRELAPSSTTDNYQVKLTVSALNNLSDLDHDGNDQFNVKDGSLIDAFYGLDKVRGISNGEDRYNNGRVVQMTIWTLKSATLLHASGAHKLPPRISRLPLPEQ